MMTEQHTCTVQIIIINFVSIQFIVTSHSNVLLEGTVVEKLKFGLLH